MSDTLLRGTISFVHYEKHFATIAYKQGGKSKSINFKTKEKAGAKPQHFRIGDEVSFRLRLTDRGDRMTATGVEVLFNPQLEKLTQKALHENRFSGYLKKVDDQFFVKEQETYLFFPLKLSPWENHPAEQSFNAPVTFKLLNPEKPKQVAAALYYQVFSPAYRQALEAKAAQKTLPARVVRISQYAVYLELMEGKMQTKIGLPAPGLEAVKEGDSLEVIISYLSPEKLVVVPVQQAK